MMIRTLRTLFIETFYFCSFCGVDGAFSLKSYGGGEIMCIFAKQKWYL